MHKQLEDIRSYLNQTGMDAVLITRTDSFLGDYFPPFKNRLKEVTNGFSGSAGLSLVSADKAVLFVDSRYTLQAKKQTNFTVYEVPTETMPSDWLKENLAGAKIGFNPWTHSYSWVKQMEKILQSADIRLTALDSDVLVKWFGSDSFEQMDIFDYPIKYAGQSSDSKLNLVAQLISDKAWDAFVVCSPENISWLLNKRAKTVTEYPVVFERGIVDKNGKYTPFSDEGCLLFQNKRIGLDFSKTPLALFNQLQKICFVEHGDDPIDLLKASKNEVEINHIKQACLSESKVICRFLAWIEENKMQVDEIACDLKLKKLRKEETLYFADSFQTIAASGSHAALAHYVADIHTNQKVCSNPLLLVDTGAHYLNGTTDMTRTICTGNPTGLMKRRYTQVLKGHISLASEIYILGETTGLLDEKAHQFLRSDNVDYLHATGHGIGMMLAVHEMPPVIHEKDTNGLVSGMVFSNEPAYYSLKEGFGIRLENMLLTIPKEKQSLAFQNLLFIPFDYRLVDFSLLTIDEKEWLKVYHKEIETKVFPLLSENERDILYPFVKAFELRG